MPRRVGPSVRLDTAIRTFFEFLEQEKLAESTLGQKQRTLRYLVKAAGGPHRMTQRLTYEHFDMCLRDLANGPSEAERLARAQQHSGTRHGRSPNSLKIDKSNLNQFVKWLKRNEWVRANFDPLFKITSSSKRHPGKTPERVYRARRVEPEQWPALLATCEHPRDRMVIAAGLFWGTRASSTVQIRIRHLDLTKNTVELFNVKKGRWYMGDPIEIVKPMRYLLDQYLAWYIGYYGLLQPDWYLTPVKVPGVTGLGRVPASAEWPINPERPMAAGTVIKIAKKALRGIGWTDDMFVHEGSHTLRRSGGTEVQARGGLDAAMGFFDHQEAATTLRYTHNAPGKARMKEALDRIVLPGQPEPEAVTPESELPLAEVIDLSSRRRVG